MNATHARVEVTAAEELPQVHIARLRAGDLIVLHYDKPIDDATVAHIRADLKPRFPENEVLILEDGMTLSIVRKDSD